MREIKFRGWDLESKTMLNNDHFMDEVGAFMRLPMWSEIILMQYAGLKDSEEVEIYEGDIVFISRNLEEPNRDGDLYLVKWETNGFAIRKQVTITNGVKKESKHVAIINRVAVENHSVVIGNIYENPHLLEG